MPSPYDHGSHGLREKMDEVLKELGQIRTNLALVTEALKTTNEEYERLTVLMRGDSNGEQGMLMKQGFMMRDIAGISTTLKDIESRLCNLEDSEIRREARQAALGTGVETAKERWIFWGKAVAIAGACATGIIELVRFLVEKLSQHH